MIRLVLLFLCFAFPCWAGGYCLSYCNPGPLHPCLWSVAARAGGAVTSYAQREKIWLTTPQGVISGGDLPHFFDQFHFPWEVDGEIAYNFSNHIQAFLQYQFQQGGGKRHRGETSWSRYQTHSGYLGSRWVYNGCCTRCYGRIAPFVGFKVGLMWREKIRAQIEDRDILFSRAYLNISSGLQAGIEWWMTWYWSLIFQIDGIATQGFRANRNARFDPPLASGVTNINYPGGAVIFSFPITAGMRFTF